MNDWIWFALCVALVAALVAVIARRRPVQDEPATRPPREEAPDLLGQILDRMNEGVLVFNDSLTPILANPAARELLGFEAPGLPPRIRPDSIHSLARRAIAGNRSAEDTVQIWPGRKILRVRATPLPDGNGCIVVLNDATDELRAQQIRRQFVSSASHELKSPVAALQTLAEAVKNAAADDEEAVVRFSDKLVSEAQRLGRLITDLLDLSRVEDPTHAATRDVDLSHIVDQELDRLDAAAVEKSITLVRAVTPGLRVKGDEAQLGLLVRNLVDNAIRYTPDGGRVDVLLDRRDDVVLEVRDDGIGIPLQAQGRIFERFYRVDSDRSREKGGTGLGLSIVKHVAEMHGGHVALQSELDRGSTFTVHLPVLRTTESLEQMAG